MNMNNLRYVICDENKAPKHSYEDYKRLNEVKDEDNLGILIDEPYVIIDLDDENEFKILKQLQEVDTFGSELTHLSKMLFIATHL